MGWTLHMIMCVLLCYPVSIRIYYQQGVLFLVFFLESKLSNRYHNFGILSTLFFYLLCIIVSPYCLLHCLKIKLAQRWANMAIGQCWPNEGLPTKTQAAEVGPTVGQWWIFIQDGGEQ